MYRSYIAKNPVLVSILLFLVLFGSISIMKPGFLYNTNGSLRTFGIGYRNKTIVPIWLISILLGILCYLFVLYYLSKHAFF